MKLANRWCSKNKKVLYFFDKSRHLCYTSCKHGRLRGVVCVIEKSNLSEVRKNIEECVGQKVLLRGSLGRNKSFEKEGTLLNTYPNIFVVKMDDTQRNVTYTYTDVLTKTVELGINSNGGYDSILNTMNPEVKI